jgi:long-chain acyl-CoA synthetase
MSQTDRPVLLDQPELLYTDLIRINAGLYADKPAVVCGDTRLSWRDFHRRTNQVANALLAHGLQRGDKVCLVMNSSVPMFELIWGVIKAAGVVVPLNVMMAGDSLGLTINDCDAQLLFADASTRAAVDSVRGTLGKIASDGYFLIGERAEGWADGNDFVAGGAAKEVPLRLTHADGMNIIYSSGSTGVPKGIEHSHFARHIYSVGFGPGLEMSRFSVAICTTPLYTNGTWITMLPAVYLGGTTVLMTKFSAEGFFETVQREHCTHVFMVPTQYIVLLECSTPSRYDLSSMQVLLSGGQAIAARTFTDLQALFAKARIFECYGITEGFITLASPEDKALPGKDRTVGLPMFGGEIVILDDDGQVLPAGEVGDITGYGPALMKGYYRRPDITAKMIWRDPQGRTFLRSGDLGRMDEDGYLYIAGRIKDMIKSGGINVYASDIEEVFMQHPDVVEVAAIGIPHDKWVETPLLLAIMRDGATVTPEELMAWGNPRLGKWQRVSAVEYRSEFPRATHDKILKRALRDPYWPADR